ncbi:MAG: hypothetical protein ACTTH5_03005, partial [Wolinella sp.]
MEIRELETFTQMVDYLIEHYEGILEAYTKSEEIAKRIEAQKEEIEAHTRASLSAQKLAQESALSAKESAEATKALHEEIKAKVCRALMALEKIRNALGEIDLQSIIKEFVERESSTLYPRLVDTLVTQPNFARLKKELLDSLNELKDLASELSILNAQHAQKAQESAQNAKASELSAKESAERARAIALGDIKADLEKLMSEKIAQALLNISNSLPLATTQKHGLLSSEDKQKLERLKFDETQQFVTKEQMQRWDNKAEKSRASSSEDGLMSAEDKRKLDGFAHKDDGFELFKILISIRELRRELEQ